MCLFSKHQWYDSAAAPKRRRCLKCGREEHWVVSPINSGRWEKVTS